MHVKYLVVSLGILAIAALLFVDSSGCSTRSEQIDVPTVPSNAPLSVFILGEWLSTEVTSQTSGAIDLQYTIAFETKSQVKFIVIYPDGNREGHTSPYSFIDENSISVDSKRTGSETWVLERKGDGLVITRNFGKNTTIIVLERVK
jgi:hypothetical protein